MTVSDFKTLDIPKDVQDCMDRVQEEFTVAVNILSEIYVGKDAVIPRGRYKMRRCRIRHVYIWAMTIYVEVEIYAARGAGVIAANPCDTYWPLTKLLQP